MNRSLQSKITTVMWIMAVASTLIAAVMSGTLLLRSHHESIRRQLQATGTSLLSLGISDFSELSDFEKLNAFIENALQMEKAGKIIRIYDASRKLIFTTVKMEYDRLPTKILQKPTKPLFMTMEGESRTYETLIIPYENPEKKRRYYLQVVMPLPHYRHLLESLWWQALFFFLLLIFLSWLLSHWLSARLLHPVSAIANHLQTMAPLKPEQWTSMQEMVRGQYLGPIIVGINTLISNTKSAFHQLERMSRYVAHELRTPLTIMRGESEMVLQKAHAPVHEYQQVLKSSLEEVERMSEIVTTVLQLGNKKEKEPLLPQRIALLSWLRENQALWKRTLGRPILLQDGVEKEKYIEIDPRLLFRLIDNLVRNVKEHTPISAQCIFHYILKNDSACLEIRDTGPGMPTELLEKLQQRSSWMEGSGVGLNLCFHIASVCNIELSFMNHPAGGLLTTLSFHSSQDS